MGRWDGGWTCVGVVGGKFVWGGGVCRCGGRRVGDVGMLRWEMS